LIQNDEHFAEVGDRGKLFALIQKDSRLGFSAASFVRQAIFLR
jgi:hypothetical protein